MQKLLFIVLFIAPLFSFSQSDSAVAKKNKVKNWSNDESETKVFYSQKIINANSVEVLPKGIMEFRVSHSFGDIAGDNGGIKRFFGMDNAADIRIGFQAGLAKNFNLILARDRGVNFGPGSVLQLYELGFKYQILKQQEGDPSHPLSLTVFANSVVSSMTANVDDGYESSFRKFSDRTSETIQVMIAKKVGKVSFQLSPTYVTRGLVIPGDDKGIFAIGAAIRLPITQHLFFIADYFHSFHSQASKDLWAADTLNRNTKFYDAIGAGFEILTGGHVFHINFTNATELLENRFIPHTVTSWGKGQFRWAFTISRNFTIFRDKKNK
ncbi:MAG: DUF5777 family beta-barrel protein [Chitinophagaceae bacterium]